MNFELILYKYLIPWGLNIALAIAIIFAGKYLANLVSKGLKKILKKGKMDDMLIRFITSIVRILILLFSVVAALNRLGLDTTSLIALLGAAGLAVGLALQGSLQNFAAGVLLLVFRPFKTGDYVSVSGVEGVITDIMIFSTRLLTPDNREITVPNGSIYGTTIINFSNQENRRIDLTIGIGYDDDIKKARDIMAKLINNHDKVLKDPAPQIAVGELGDSSVNFYVRPWVKSGDYWGVRFDLIEQIKLAFDAEGVGIPYPQMDIHMKKD